MITVATPGVFKIIELTSIIWTLKEKAKYLGSTFDYYSPAININLKHNGL